MKKGITEDNCKEKDHESGHGDKGLLICITKSVLQTGVPHLK